MYCLHLDISKYHTLLHVFPSASPLQVTIDQSPLREEKLIPISYGFFGMGGENIAKINLQLQQPQYQVG
jgi:hypothetical protein